MATIIDPNSPSHYLTTRDGIHYSHLSIKDVLECGNRSIDNLIREHKWFDYSGSTGETLWLSYSFGSTESVYNYTDRGSPYQIPMNPAQLAAATAAMQAYANVTNIHFYQTTDTATNAGDIRWAMYGNPDYIHNSYSSYPHDNAKSGDVWIAKKYVSPAKGTNGYFVFLHELGHALGLGHPHEKFNLPPKEGEDQLKYTVMSYRSHAGDVTDDGHGLTYLPTTLMLNDIQTVQYLYGANTTYHAGDDTYSWAAGKCVFETIWDAGGNDTLSAATQTMGCVLNLKPGEWSQIGEYFFNEQENVRDCLAIAYGTVIENAIGSAFDDVLYGNGVDNCLYGQGGSDALSGKNGNDHLYGGGGDDSLDGGAGADMLSGGQGSDALYGVDGKDTLYGGLGDDYMCGGAGNDTYGVDSELDVIDESADGGFDLVNVGIATAGATYLLSGNVENATVTSTAVGVNITGNASGNALTGNAYANFLDGAEGFDTLRGGDGKDTLYGGSDDDVLSGGMGGDMLNGNSGIDTMFGGAGNDTYLVDDAGDKVYETTTSTGTTDATGVDTVISSQDWTLGAYVENLTLAEGGGDRVGTGNGLANILVGNEAANVLMGKGGGDAIDGGAGNDIIYGGAGNDRLTGADGSDIFVFDTKPDAIANVDTIVDFAPGADRIRLENAIFAKLTGTGPLLADNFVRGKAAVDANDYIIYDDVTGNLFYDADGSGAIAKVKIATLTDKPSLTATDFLVS